MPKQDGKEPFTPEQEEAIYQIARRAAVGVLNEVMVKLFCGYALPDILELWGHMAPREREYPHARILLTPEFREQMNDLLENSVPGMIALHRIMQESEEESGAGQT